MLFLRPAGGLCNRLKALKSAIGLMTSLNRRLVVCWRLDREMNISFGRLFQLPDCFKIYDGVHENFITKTLFSKYNWLMNVPDNDAHIAERIKERGLLPSALTTYHDFYEGSESTYDWLKPIDELQSQIDSIRESMPKDIVGVHIRRTDNQTAIANSPIDLFMEKLDYEISNNGQKCFFVATDDEATKRLLGERYGERIFTRKGLPSRDDIKGVPNAVIDLFLLASCSKLYGSCGSTFSQEAAKIGKIAFEVVQKASC